MSKGQQQKETKGKKAAKSLMEKRKEKRDKKANK